MWVRSLGWEDALEEETVTCSSILAWKIPRTEEPGRLQSMRSQRVERNWAQTHARACTHTHTHTHESLRASLPGLELQPQLRAEAFQLSPAQCSCCTGQKNPWQPQEKQRLNSLTGTFLKESFKMHLRQTRCTYFLFKSHCFVRYSHLWSEYSLSTTLTTLCGITNYNKNLEYIFKDNDF